MADYVDIYGKRVKVLDSDPTLTSSYEGQVWYNSTTGTLKSLLSSAAWSSSTPMITARSQVAGAGLQTAGLAMGGSPSSSSAPSRTNGNLTEEYNGSGWSSQAACPLYKRQGTAFGTQTAAAFFGGYDDPQGYEATLAEYDGSSWTTGGSYPSDISNFGGGAGTLTAGYNAAGNNGSTNINSTFEYDGSSWTGSGNLPWSAANCNNLGTQTAGLAVGGNIPPQTNNVATYDGSSWTATTSAPSPLQGQGSSGIQTDAVLYGGNLPSAHSTTTIKWDGSSWTTSAALAQGRNNAAGCGISPASTDAFYAGGDVSESTVYANTEEYNESINTITPAAWASSGAMNTARTGLASAGTKNANVFMGGQLSNAPYGGTGATELYDGSTWTTNPNSNPSTGGNNCGTGTQTAALSWGGYPNISTTLEFDGSSYTTTGALGTGRELTSNNIGVQTAAIAAGGFQRPGTYPTQTEEYNGSSWTAGPAINTPGYGRAGSGTETAAVISGGIDGGGQINATEEYNGSSWTTVNARPYSGGNAGTSGTQTDSLVYGGNPSSALTTTVRYDGTNWATAPNMANSRAMSGSSAAGTSTAALASSASSGSTATEEFNGETTAVVAKTLTTS